MIRRAIVTLICVLAPIAGVAAASASPMAQVAPQQQTAELFTAHTVYSAPDGSRLTSVADHRPLTRERTVLPVLASTIDNSVDASGQLWLEVRLPGRTLTGSAPRTRKFRVPLGISSSTSPRGAYWSTAMGRRSKATPRSSASRRRRRRWASTSLRKT
jgi:hypothetical protein